MCNLLSCALMLGHTAKWHLATADDSNKSRIVVIYVHARIKPSANNLLQTTLESDLYPQAATSKACGNLEGRCSTSASLGATRIGCGSSNWSQGFLLQSQITVAQQVGKISLTQVATKCCASSRAITSPCRRCTECIRALAPTFCLPGICCEAHEARPAFVNSKKHTATAHC